MEDFRETSPEITSTISKNPFQKFGSFLSEYKKIIIPVLGIILISVLAFSVWQIFKGPKLVSQFELKATIEDSAGVEPETDFILKSSQDISAATVKKILSFEPEIDFEVNKKTGGGIFGTGIFKAVFAQEQDSSSKPSNFELKPKETLKEDTIYRVVITDEEVADREYGWAFQVKAPFQAISTHPRDQGTHVPINSGVEITFNRENFISPREYFEINPEVQGTFEISGSTFVFLPKGLNPETIYTVTIKEGLAVHGSDEKLAQDYTFQFETGVRRYTGYAPYFDFQNDFLEFIPDRKPTFKFFSSNLDVKSLEFNIYKFPDIDEFLGSYQGSRKWALGWTYYWRRNTGSTYQPSPASKVLTFEPEVVEVGYERFIEIPQALEEGYYLIDTNIGGVRRQAWLQITPLAHYFSVTDGQSLVWVYDFEKQKPLSASRVAFVESGDKKHLANTDQEGFVSFSTPQALREDPQKKIIDPQFFRIDHNSYQSVLIKIADSWGYHRKAGKGDQYWDYLSTDRYTYQMNDTLRYWGIVKGRTQDLRQKKVSVGIYKGWWGQQEPLLQEEVLISSFDTIQGQFQFAGLTPGYYNLAVTLGDETVTNVDFEVLTYTKPAYQINITASKPAIFAGETVNFDIQASFFDGTPVPNLALEYSAYWQRSIRGKVTLDESGKGNFSYAPDYYESQYAYWPRNFTITFSPELSEEGEIWGTGRVLVFGPQIHLQAFQEKESGNTHKLTAKLNDIVLDNIASGGERFGQEYIGEPTKGHPISAKIVKVTYRKIETGQYYDYINKVVRKSYRYDKQEQTIEQLSGTTDTNGEWAFTRDFPQEEGSTYRIDFSTQDSRGRNAKKSTYIWFASYGSWKDFSASLSINNSSYEEEFSIGDKVDLELRILEGEAPAKPKVLFYRYQNSITKTAIVPSLKYSENFERPFLPSVQYRAVVLGPYGFEETNSVTASFREDDANLSIDIALGKESYRPGEDAKLAFRVTDKNNKPVVSELNVSVVDESLFHILPYAYYNRDILSELYKNIWVSPVAGASQYAFLKLAEGGAESGGCFAGGTSILMVDGSLRNIEDIKIGDQILTRKSLESPELVSAIVQGISQHSVNEYLVINGSLAVTPEHRLNINGGWIYAGEAKKGDTLIREDGEVVEVVSVDKKQGIIPVYNIVVSKYHTYFAGGFWVHNEEKGGAPRTNFVDVAFYETLKTNEDGEAQATFALPDNITAWRVTTMAFSPDSLKAGEDIELINTSLPFFVDATLNKFYLVGDQPMIRIRSFGSDVKLSKEIVFEVKSDSLGINEEKRSSNGAAFISLGSLREGEHEITISAKQGEYQDAIVRKISVVKSYFKRGESSFYQVSNNLSNIDGNKDGFTRLVFTDLGKGRLYWRIRWNMYNSGIRIDQAVPRYLSSKFLSQYFDEPWQGEPLDLASYHLGNGGLGLFPYSSDDLALSSKLADLVPEFVFKDQLKSYLYSSLTDEKADIHRISQALYGLASFKEPVLVKINLVKEDPNLTLEDKIYLALALSKIGDKENARLLYFNQIRNNLRFQGDEAWLYQEADTDKRVKLTGLTAVLASYLKLDDARPLGEYIFSHDPERDLDSLEEFLYIKSELERTKKAKTAKFTYETNSRFDTVELEKGRIFELTLPHSELQSIRFEDIEGDVSLVSFYERARSPQELKKNQELSVTRSYLVNSRQTNSFSESDMVLVRLDPKIASSAIDGQYQIIDYLPSGLKPVTQIYRKGLSGGTECNPIWYPSIIENNTLYFNVWKGFNKTQQCSNRTINYYARVVSKGSFKANPTLIQSLKDLESLNVSNENQVDIK